ncbi:PHP domain-containing protein [Hydrogenoanaerobacterium sp.]|uniref:PHP domain-containing protein n=1 Tax=Hydrogenoanaerobacterium sp. TaxID=2953763 RepID=UPI00289E682C|nr:PHP domain-containing protein [Hydrogenoanaerobacterium sp.]
MKYFDLHTHTVMSDGDCTPQQLLDTANSKGYGLGISDHLFCCKLLTLRDVEHYLNELDRYDVLHGVEANLGENFTLPHKLDERVDYVIASVHSVQDLNGESLQLGPYFCDRAGDEGALPYTRTFTQDEAKYYLEQILRIYEFDFKNQRVDILGHCTVHPFYDALLGQQHLSDWQDETVALCKKYDVAMEISGLWHCPDEELIRKAHLAGVKFSLGSDCHQPKHTCNLDYALNMLHKLGVAEDRLFTA